MNLAGFEKNNIVGLLIDSQNFVRQATINLHFNTRWDLASKMNYRLLKENKLSLQILLPLWFLYMVNIVLDLSEAYLSFIIIFTPIVIFILEGFEWLKNYEWNNWITYGLVFYFLTTLISQLIGPNFWEGLDGIRQYHGKSLLVGIGLLFLFQKRSNREILLWTLWFSALLSVLLAYNNYFEVFGSYFWKNRIPGRLTAFGRYPNTFAGIFSFLLPLFTAMGCREIGSNHYFNWKTISTLGVVVAAIPIVIWTETRAAQIGSLLGILIVILLYSIVSKNYKIINLFLVFLIIFTSCLLWTTGGSQAKQRWERNLLDNKRIEYDWPVVLEKALERPIFGLSFSTDFFENPDINVPHEHNIFLFYLLRSGLIGLTGFVLFYVILLIVTLKYIFELKINWILLLGCMGALISGVIINGFFSNNPHHWITRTLILYIFVFLNKKDD